MSQNQDTLDLAARRSWDLANLADALGFGSVSALCAALSQIDRRGYDRFIQRRGNSRRVISAPRDWLKALQVAAKESLLLYIPVSSVICSRRGRSLITHAEHHVRKPFVTTMDVADCYPNTGVQQVLTALQGTGLRQAVAGALTRLTTHNGFLPQGAPTSPLILDIVFRPIDETLCEIASSRGAEYTRFADDLAFSADSPLRGLGTDVDRVLRRHGYKNNVLKLRACGPVERHVVAGIDVTNDPQPTRSFYNELSAQMNAFARGDASLTAQSLEGRIGWVSQFDSAAASVYLNRLRHMSQYVRA